MSYNFLWYSTSCKIPNQWRESVKYHTICSIHVMFCVKFLHYIFQFFIWFFYVWFILTCDFYTQFIHLIVTFTHFFFTLVLLQNAPFIIMFYFTYSAHESFYTWLNYSSLGSPHDRVCVLIVLLEFTYAVLIYIFTHLSQGTL